MFEGHHRSDNRCLRITIRGFVFNVDGFIVDHYFLFSNISNLYFITNAVFFQILNSDVELNEQEKAKLFANGVEPLKSPRNTPVPGTPTPGCPACGMHSKCNISGTKKQNGAFSIVPKKLELRTPKATIVYRNTAVPTIKPRTIRSAPAISQTSPRKQMLHYTSPMAVRRDVRSSEERMAKPNLVCV